jgi:subtilisin family serine protease
MDGAPALTEITPSWAWGGATGQGVRVAVVDSGVDADHPALEGCVDEAGGATIEVQPDGETVAVEGPHRDADGHGTACASIIHLLAPEARITSVRVLGSNNTGKASQFIAGLAWAVERGFDVINLSLGTRKREFAMALHDLCDDAYFRGTLVVTAANNVALPSFPSLYSSVASVACNLSRDPYRFHANPSPPTEFLARGIDLEVAWRGGETSRVTGNSFAAPHIAGMAALIRSKHPGLRPFQLKAVLWATAANVLEAGGGLGAGAPEIAGRYTRMVTGVHSRRATGMVNRTVVRRATESTPDGTAPGQAQ